VATNLGCRKHPLLRTEIGAGHGEDFLWYLNGDIEPIHEVSCVNEEIVDSFHVFPNLETSEL